MPKSEDLGPFGQDKRIFRLQHDHACSECGQPTRFAASGLHALVCSPACLRRQVEKVLDHFGLTQYVEVKP